MNTSVSLYAMLEQMTISYKHANERSTINQKLTWKTNQKTEGNANTWRLRDSKEGDFFFFFFLK